MQSKQKARIIDIMRPVISLEFVTNVSLTNLTRREADISLRLVSPETENLVISRIAQMATALHVSSEDLAQYPFDFKQKVKGHLAVTGMKCLDTSKPYMVK